MRKKPNLLAAMALLAALGGCGRQQPAAGGVGAEDERALDNAAAMTQDNVFDTSPDDMSMNADDAVVDENGGAPGNRVGNAQ